MSASEEILFDRSMIDARGGYGRAFLPGFKVGGDSGERWTGGRDGVRNGNGNGTGLNPRARSFFVCPTVISALLTIDDLPDVRGITYTR